MVDAIRAGDRLGDYHIDEVLRKEDDFVLARGTHPVHKLVLLQILSATAPEDRRSRQRREFKLLRRYLRSAPAAPEAIILDDSIEGVDVLVCEFVDGLCLGAAKVPVHDELELISELEWMREAARALGGIHDAGMLHRNLRPSNILLGHLGRRRAVTFLDFSLSDAPGAQTSSDLLRLMSPRYVTPQLVAGRSPHLRDDLYALCACFAEHLLGHHPLVERGRPEPTTAKGWWELHQSAPRPEVSASLAIRLLPSVDRLFLRGLSVERTDPPDPNHDKTQFHTADELVAQIEGVVRDLREKGRDLDPPPISEESAPPPRQPVPAGSSVEAPTATSERASAARFSRFVWIATAVGALLVLATVVAVWRLSVADQGMCPDVTEIEGVLFDRDGCEDFIGPLTLQGQTIDLMTAPIDAATWRAIDRWPDRLAPGVGRPLPKMVRGEELKILLERVQQLRRQEGRPPDLGDREFGLLTIEQWRELAEAPPDRAFVRGLQQVDEWIEDWDGEFRPVNPQGEIVRLAPDTKAAVRLVRASR